MAKATSHKKPEPLIIEFKYKDEPHTANADIKLDGTLVYSKLSFSKFPEADLVGAPNAATGKYAWDISTIKHPLRNKAKYFGGCILMHLKEHQIL